MNSPFGNPPGGEMGGGPFFPGARTTPGYQPTPNSEPTGAITGAPVRTRLLNLPLVPNQATQVDGGSRENRVLLITPPDIGFTVFAGEAGVTPDVGLALLGGQSNEIVLPGFQQLYLVTNAPITIRVSIQTASILMAERERRL